MNYGYVKVASAIPSLKVADCSYNIQQIESLIIQAEGKGVEIITFPADTLVKTFSGNNFCSRSVKKAFTNYLTSPAPCRLSPLSACLSWLVLNS